MKKKKYFGRIPIALVLTFIVYAITNIVTHNIALSNLRKEVIINNMTYQSGFYGSLEPYQVEEINHMVNVNDYEFFKIFHNEFDLVFTKDLDGYPYILYCSNNHWDEANAFYQEDSNYTYYIRYGIGFSHKEPSTLTSINGVNPELFDELIEMATYYFGAELAEPPKRSKIIMKTRNLDEVFNFNLYKESTDGLFTTFRNFRFYIIDNKMLYEVYNIASKNGSETVFYQVPDDIAEHFINIVNKNAASD